LTWSLTATATNAPAPGAGRHTTLLSFQKLDVCRCAIELVGVAVAVAVADYDQGRVAPGDRSPRGSHRSGLARLTHPAPQLRGSLSFSCTLHRRTRGRGSG
jgi:hypothetical protein